MSEWLNSKLQVTALILGMVAWPLSLHLLFIWGPSWAILDWVSDYVGTTIPVMVLVPLTGFCFVRGFPYVVAHLIPVRCPRCRGLMTTETPGLSFRCPTCEEVGGETPSCRGGRQRRGERRPLQRDRY